MIGKYFRVNIFKPNISKSKTNIQKRDASTQFLFGTPTTRRVIGVPRALYGGRHTVTMLPGGGIGPELMKYVEEVFRYAGAPVDFEVIETDPHATDNDDLRIAVTSIRRNGVAIKGNIETSSQKTTVKSRNVALRKELDLYVGVVDVKAYPGIQTRKNNVDVAIIRQNTDGEYSMMEHQVVKGVVESLKIVTRWNSKRVARYAFEYALMTSRDKVTTVHKANIMKLTDGLFLECCKQIAHEYPEIQHDNMIIDNCCMQLITRPEQFQVLVMPNLYGTIISNLVCGLVGGVGLYSGRSLGDHYAVFEPGTRNTGTKIAGKNVANPVAMLNASVDMLEYLGHEMHAKLIRQAINKTISMDLIHSRDLGGKASSTDVVHRIVDNMLILIDQKQSYRSVQQQQ